jgi:hypothetical protein
MAQDYGGAMAGDFDHVFGRVGMRGFEKRGDHLVHGAALGIDQLGQLRPPGL